MKRLKLLALLAVFALFAAACGGSDSDTEEATTTDDDTTEVAASDDGDERSHGRRSHGRTEAEDEAPAASTAGQGGELTLLQWQAPSQANVLLSGGTKDALAASLVIEPLARFDPDGVLQPALAEFIPTAGNGISDDLTEITWTLKTMSCGLTARRSPLTTLCSPMSTAPTKPLAAVST